MTTAVRDPGTVTRLVRSTRLHAHGWWLGALAIFAGSRVISSVLMVVTIHLARPQSRIGLNSGFAQAFTAWDGQWYWLIAATGYPTHLPVDATGTVQTSAWAFLPAFPYLVSWLCLGVVAAWPATAVSVSALFGVGACVLLAALLRPHAGTRGALIAVAFFACSPVGFILQAAYAESMGLFLQFGVLLLIDRRRYWLAIAPSVLLAFTRPGMQAVALTVAGVLVVRAIAARRGGTAMPRSEWVAGGVLLLATTVLGFVWGWIAGWVTGNPNAYLLTETAWRLLWTGKKPFAPFVSWAYAADFWFGRFGPVALAVAAAAAVALVLLPAMRRIGTTNRIWVASWFVYLAAVFFPQSSVFRILLPAAPAWGAAGAIRSRVAIGVLLGLSIVAQAYWLFRTYGGHQYYWTVP